MTKPIVQETNTETGETVEREMTAAEIKARDAVFAEMSKAITDNAVKAEQKAALLERLGISEDEAKLLLA
jgi:hypothetical protein